VCYQISVGGEGEGYEREKEDLIKCLEIKHGMKENLGGIF